MPKPDRLNASTLNPKAPNLNARPTAQSLKRIPGRRTSEGHMNTGISEAGASETHALPLNLLDLKPRGQPQEIKEKEERLKRASSPVFQPACPKCVCVCVCLSLQSAHTHTCTYVRMYVCTYVRMLTTCTLRQHVLQGRIVPSHRTCCDKPSTSELQTLTFIP